MDIYDRVNAMGGDALEVAENNIGGHTVTWPCSPNPIARHFTSEDLEAGEFERWFGDIIANIRQDAITEVIVEAAADSGIVDTVSVIEEPPVEDSKSDGADAEVGTAGDSQDEGTGANPD